MTSTSANLEWWTLDRIFAEVLPGLPGYEEVWSDVISDIRYDSKYRQALEGAILSLDADSEVESLKVGSDGRLWEGHFQVVAAYLLGFTTLPVQIVDRVAVIGDLVTVLYD